MTELSGTLEGVGLPAIVRFLSGLKKTGCLRVENEDWRAEIFFEAGNVTSASLGARQGVSALEALIQALPGGSFTFDLASRAAGDANISLSPEALQTYLEDLAAQTASGAARLPSLDAVPTLVSQDASSANDEPLPLGRGALQTLLAIDGQRTVREIVALRGSLDVLWQLGNLLEVGLLRLSPTVPATPTKVPTTAPKLPTRAPTARVLNTAAATRTTPPVAHPRAAAPSVEPRAVQPEPVEATQPRPFVLEVVAEEATAHCPKLGFEDDPSNSFGRPTRLHRCFAGGTPLPLSLDQQRELCLSDQFGTCPRLTLGGFVPAARDDQLPEQMSAARRHAGSRPEAESDDPRIVRLPFVAPANAAERGAVADRQAVGGSEPTRFRSGGRAARDGASTLPTPLRSRVDRATRAGSDSRVAEPPTAPTPEPRETDVGPVPRIAVGDPAERRVGGIPVGVIASGSVVLVVLAVIAYLLAPRLGDLFADDTLDPTALPNTSAVASGTPIAQVTALPATPAARATAASAATDAGAADASAATNNDATSASAVAPAAPQRPQPTQAAAPTGAAPPAAATVLDERFANNDRNWPSTLQGTAFVTNGGYRLVPRQAGQFVTVGAPIANVPKDVIVNATFHKINGPAGGGYGIIVRDQAPTPQNGTSQEGHYYVLEVGDKGEVGIWRRDGDHWVDLLPWQINAAVKLGTASNEISVRAIDNRLSLSVNGTQVATKTDDTFASGGAGLFVGGDGNQVSVDRFSIQTP